jgi:hypothetical protein
MDEALAHEAESMERGTPVEARSREDLVKEEDEVIPASTRPGFEDPLDTNRRAELARHLAAADWPATGDHLVSVAEADHASDDLLDALRRLPRDQRFETVEAVWEALGGRHEGHHTHR